MDRETYQRGLQIRSEVLGEEYVNRALANADDFTGPLQDLVTEYCWGAVWGREELPLKTRSMLNLAMISVLNRPQRIAHSRQGGTDQRCHPRGDPRDLPAGRHLRRRAGRRRQLSHRAVRRSPNWTQRVSGRIDGRSGSSGWATWVFPWHAASSRRTTTSSPSTRAATALRARRRAGRTPGVVARRRRRPRRNGAGQPADRRAASLEVATGPAGVIEGARVQRYVDLSTVGSQTAAQIHGLLAAARHRRDGQPGQRRCRRSRKGHAGAHGVRPARRIRRRRTALETLGRPMLCRRASPARRRR